MPNVLNTNIENEPNGASESCFLEALSEREASVKAAIDKLAESMFIIYSHFANHPDFGGARLSKITDRIKEDKEGQQYGYFHNKHVGSLYLFLRYRGIKSMIDLGSGAGIVLACLQCIDKKIKLHGVEIEEELVSISRGLGVSTTQKDILKINKGDLKDYEAIYLYEPFYDNLTVKRFVARLADNIYKGQTVIVRAHGKIGLALCADKRLMLVKNGKSYLWEEYQVFKKC